MMGWIVAGIGALIGLLVLLKVFASVSAILAKRRAAAPTKRRGLDASLEREIDERYEAALAPWPVLQVSYLFWVAVALSGIMVAFDIRYGLTKGAADATMAALYIMMFVACDALLPVVTFMSDRGNSGKWWLDRPVAAWVAMIICTLISCFVVIGSTGEIATASSAQGNIAKLGYEQRVAQLDALQKEHDGIPAETQAPAALDELAKAKDDLSKKEAKRGYCGKKCDDARDESAAYAARAANARRKDALRQQIAAARADLEKSAPRARTQGDTLGSSLEDFTGGAIERSAVDKHAMTMFGLAIAILTTFVWAAVSDRYQDRMVVLKERFGREADDERRMAGLPPKYITQTEAALALASPVVPAGDTIVINSAAEDMRRRYANDPELLETDSLFGTLVVADETSMCVLATLYRAYRKRVLEMNQSARYMTEVTMAQKIRIISQHRDDVAFSADGRIKGWRLASETAKVAIAAE